jgi:uncharacterized protein (UPF0276 family)
MSFARNDLGHGIGLRHTHYAEILRDGVRGVPWFEAITENYFTRGGRPWAVLERVRRDAHVVLHGVSLGVGNADPISEAYLASLERVVERVEPAWVSDHLCWSAVGGRYAHDLLPMPYTRETVEHVVARVAAVQERLGRALLLENPSAYLAFAESDLAECDVLNEIAHRTGCGVLLDVNNVVVCAKNLGIDAERYVDAIDPRVVGQIHLAGHSPHGDMVIDSHVGPVPEAVWALYRRAVARCGRVPTIVEWDEAIPAYDVLVRESERARAIEAEVLAPRADEARDA